MKKIICNPLNLPYRYQFKNTPVGKLVYREAADPTVVVFKGKYYLFASMSGGFWYSDDLFEWSFKATPELPIYDYAPDVRQIGDKIIFSASKRNEACVFYQSKDPLREPFTPLKSAFAFWDPDIFEDDDGRVYFYWGCTNTDPIYGIELNAETLEPISEPVSLFGENVAVHGFERSGENNKLEPPKTEMERVIREKLGTMPFIEGAFMTKHNGKYYLQYAAPATECNTYADGVYVSEHPLSGFVYQKHNPFSTKPGGFIRAAGHGSTFCDLHGNYWHISSMSIGINEGFERRLGLFPCAFDEDGILWCNQNFADYPLVLPNGKRTDMERNSPTMNLLSYNVTVSSSSHQTEYPPENAVDENAKTWWVAAENDTDSWVQLDLGTEREVQCVQLNFADHNVPFDIASGKTFVREDFGTRFILTEEKPLNYNLEGSADGEYWQQLAKLDGAKRDCPHEIIVFEKALKLRYLKVNSIKMPLGNTPAISGFRVFGYGNEAKPAKVEKLNYTRDDARNIVLTWEASEGAQGYNVRYGIAPDKLYACWQVNDRTTLDLSTINADTSYYISVDSFGIGGVTSGTIHFVE